MAYDRPFYQVYEADYIQDPRVRANHDLLFTILAASAAFNNVADLGCGSSTEFARFARPERYIGFDLTDTPQFAPEVERVQADYRDLDAIRAYLEKRGPGAVVSLFSAELFASAAANTALYERIFREAGRVKMILTAGIHYPDRLGQEWVDESGDIRSRQTFSRIAPEEQRSYAEFRFTMPNPSRMFGNCTEVFRLLTPADIIDEQTRRLVSDIVTHPGITAVSSDFPFALKAA